MYRVLFASLLIVTAVLAQDKKDPEPKPDGPGKADIRGKVTNVYGIKARGLVGGLLIEGVQEKDTGYDRASVKVPTTAKVYRFKGGKKTEVKFADIKKGDRVQATFVGPVAESYPVQATAGEVVILDEKKAEK